MSLDFEFYCHSKRDELSDFSEIMITLYFQEARMPGSNYSVAYVGQTISDEIIAKYEAQAENLKAQLYI